MTLPVPPVDPIFDHQRDARRLQRLRRWDPLAFLFFAHGVGLALVGETERPLVIALLSGATAVIRLGIGWLVPRGGEGVPRIVTEAISIGLAYGVIAADGGTESPFFFWILLLLGWQALSFPQRVFRLLSALALFGYLAVVVAASEYTPAALFRLGLLVAFAVTMSLGRWSLDRREEAVRRLDDVVQGIIDDSPMAMAVLDADRDTLLYANAAAHRMGITSRDAMAHLLLDDPTRPQQVTTLADLVVGSSFVQSPMRVFRHIGSSRPQYRIGFHPRRIGQSRPLVLIYGISLANGGEASA
ncbi:MAG: hypothetical protein ACLFWM_04710 [Actinomycetota bacterium]